MKISYNDRWHSYRLTPDPTPEEKESGKEPASKRCKSVTNVAKVGDDSYGLQAWGKRQVALGMALEPDLIERAAAHYDDRDQLDEIAEEALKAAKSHDKAAKGTAAHRITERVDMGQQLIETPFSKAVGEAWTRALKDAGLEIVPELIERIVVYPELYIAGRFDRIAKVKRSGKYAVVDLKTGSIDYPHAIARQLAMYAHAPLMAGPIAGSGGETELFEKLPDKLDLKWGYIVHLTDDKVEVVKIDIAEGWKNVEKSVFPMLKFRDNKNLVEKLVEQEIVVGPAKDDRVAWIKGRLSDLAPNPEAKAMVIARWPAGISPKPPWTDGEIDVIDEALASVEKDTTAGFPIADPILSAGVGAV